MKITADPSRVLMSDILKSRVSPDLSDKPPTSVKEQSSPEEAEDVNNNFVYAILSLEDDKKTFAGLLSSIENTSSKVTVQVKYELDGAMSLLDCVSSTVMRCELQHESYEWVLTGPFTVSSITISDVDTNFDTCSLVMVLERHN
jgi:hypothetical protein